MYQLVGTSNSKYLSLHDRNVEIVLNSVNYVNYLLKNTRDVCSPWHHHPEIKFAPNNLIKYGCGTSK